MENLINKKVVINSTNEEGIVVEQCKITKYYRIELTKMKGLFCSKKRHEVLVKEKE